MTRVLIMRPTEDALPMLTLLESKGIKCSHYPLFKPHFLPLSPLKNPQALIITSKNAIRAIEGYENIKQIPLYAVGDKTAELAKQKGFLNVLSASGTSQDLIKFVIKNAQPENGILWHLSGEVVKGNIVESLKIEGFEIQNQVVYCLEDVIDLPASLFDELTNDRISHVIFSSSRTTTLFMSLLKKKKLDKKACHIISLCLSQDIGKQALDLKWKKVWISPKPSINDLMGYFNEEK